MGTGETIFLCFAVVTLSPAVIVGVVLKHRERMAALKIRDEKAPAGLVAEFHALRAEVSQLRETSTRFDMSFDAALQRVENRLEAVEQSHLAPQYTAYARVPVAEETVVRRG